MQSERNKTRLLHIMVATYIKLVDFYSVNLDFICLLKYKRCDIAF